MLVSAQTMGEYRESLHQSASVRFALLATPGNVSNDSRVPVRPDLFYKREWEGWDGGLGLDGRPSSSDEYEYSKGSAKKSLG